ncbi:MAG: hypothetical protein UW30_C0008G0017 [Candidatus Giovannonibacteria bacterium GW2011_GWA2_44_13b]|uniref:Uncharacterized protein n=2 Tax=Candidatus Giovannoniibacteriota TaxID=1752738 RepID=A0A0G1H4H0_9BACT|nr:MAG: hypothetical protein UW30_C0008G0017 [Candidatus Giovannonibacteria bacterium GW2011_GWA2_44_13b]OGF82667.1 MAG: hypothetical protein A2924_00690 [Candidatus Giovannonibacteria bacterium RIFCSPLOWO2_01_FULL_44_16]
MLQEKISPQEENKENKALVKKEPKELKKPFRLEDIEFVRPLKSMTAKEVLEEMKKQGIRPLTLDEAQALLKKSQADQIKSEGTDIVPEYKEIDEEQKQLPEK